jgi:hypothetical protein
LKITYFSENGRMYLFWSRRLEESKPRSTDINDTLNMPLIMLRRKKVTE